VRAGEVLDAFSPDYVRCDRYSLGEHRMDPLRARSIRFGSQRRVPAAGTHILLPIIGIAVGGLILLMRSDTMAESSMQCRCGGSLLSVVSHHGLYFPSAVVKPFLPGYFALPAGIGDTLTGVFAIGVAIALQRETPSARKLAYAVNIFGLARPDHCSLYGDAYSS